MSENYLQILAQPSQRHQRAVKSFPTSQQTHSYLLRAILCSSDEDLGEFLQILAIFGCFSRWPKIVPRFYQNHRSDIGRLANASLHCNRLGDILLGAVGAVWTKFWRKIPESTLNSKLSERCKNSPPDSSRIIPAPSEGLQKLPHSPADVF